MHKLLRYVKKASCGAMALILAASLALPAPALAAETKAGTETSAQPDQDAAAKETVVYVDNHTADRTGAMTVSDPLISDIQAPEAGKTLDEKALVTTSEGEKWQTPVLWVNGDLTIADGRAQENETYLPVIAYIVPDGYTFQNAEGAGSAYAIRLSEDVSKLFGDNRIITIYDRTSGITYIFPASVKNIFADRGQDSGREHTVVDQAASYDEETGTVRVEDEDDAGKQDEDISAGSDSGSKQPSTVKLEEPKDEEKKEVEPAKTLVDIYCSEDAKNALSRDDLEFLTDLVVNKLQPQAVNLLLKSFPAFKEAAEKGQIGKYLGLEIGYKADSTTFGSANPGWTSGDSSFCYKMWINAASVVEDKKADTPVISRSGDNLIELANTLVHETLHLFMFDYNRPGLTGMTDRKDETTDKNGKPTAKSKTVEFPAWFTEGTASAVEHNWRGRYNSFTFLRMNSASQYEDNYTASTFLGRYVNGINVKTDDGITKPYMNFDIELWNGIGYDGEKVDTVGSSYVTGYLATLYLCEMAAGKDPGIGSSMTETDSGVRFSSENLRSGMNSILLRMHRGESLDQIIADISDGRYADTTDFEKRYVKGALVDDVYQGDMPSIDFTVKYMNYLLEISRAEGRENKANGSILFPFDEDFGTPLGLNPAGTISTDIFRLIEWSGFVKSTASNETTYQTGGKSVSGKGMNKDDSGDTDAEAADDVNAEGTADVFLPAADEELPAAAKDAAADHAASEGAAAIKDAAADLAPADGAAADGAAAETGDSVLPADGNDAAPAASDQNAGAPDTDASGQDTAAPGQGTTASDQGTTAPDQSATASDQDTAAPDQRADASDQGKTASGSSGEASDPAASDLADTEESAEGNTAAEASE